MGKNTHIELYRRSENVKRTYLIQDKRKSASVSSKVKNHMINVILKTPHRTVEILGGNNFLHERTFQ